MQFSVPYNVRFITNRLKENGYQAYPVGGCVRDTLLMRIPHDWDVTTNARPDEILEVFYDHRCIEKGRHFGTIGVISEGEQIEVTTFRMEGTYSDMRRPDSVIYADELKDDLLRRDFTVNAMAFDEDGRVIDCFSGLSDLNNRIIRAVGDPERRFGEDALRIMRAVRFASELGFSIEEETKTALFKQKNLLKRIASERIFEELKRLMLGKNVSETVHEYADVLAVFVKDILNIDEEKLSLICKVLKFLPENFSLRFAAIYICGEIENPVSAVRDALISLKSDHVCIFDAVTIIEAFFDLNDLSEVGIKRMISRYGYRHLSETLELKRCIFSAEGRCSEAIEFAMAKKMAEDISNSDACLFLSDLAIDGKTLISMGMTPSPRIGEVLEMILDAVIRGEVENDKQKLIEYAVSLGV